MLRPAAVAGGAARPAFYAVEISALLVRVAGPLLLAAAAVAALLLLALAVDVVRVLRVKRRAAPLGAAPVRGARLGASAAVATPTAIGYLHPAVIVPAGFRSRVDAGEWDAVLAHECAHLARGDDWAKALQSGLLRRAGGCPASGCWAARSTSSASWPATSTPPPRPAPRRYAACLLRLATDRCGSVAPALWGRRSHIAIRVERLLRPAGGGGRVARAAALGTFTATGLAIVLSALVAVPATTRSADPLPSADLAGRIVRHPVDLAPVPGPPRRRDRAAPRAARRRAAAPGRPARPLRPPPRGRPPRSSVASASASARPLAAEPPRRAHRAAGRPAAPRTVAYVAAVPRRPCRTCLAPEDVGRRRLRLGDRPERLRGRRGDRRRRRRRRDRRRDALDPPALAAPEPLAAGSG